jgi:hypothetical protein
MAQKNSMELHGETIGERGSEKGVEKSIVDSGEKRYARCRKKTQDWGEASVLYVPRKQKSD